MSLYTKIFRQMLDENSEIFDKFKVLNDIYNKKYSQPDFKKEFDLTGEEVLNLIRKYENILCGRTEGSRNSKYSANLSEKFWVLIRLMFENIDQVGVV